MAKIIVRQQFYSFYECALDCVQDGVDCGYFCGGLLGEFSEGLGWGCFGLVFLCGVYIGNYQNIAAVCMMLDRIKRPFWVADAQVQNLSWRCPTDYGNPSGHCMTSFLFMQLLTRFITRNYKSIHRYSFLIYLLILIIELFVMFSRVILGLLAFNSVLFSITVDAYLILVFYFYGEGIILQWVVWGVRTVEKRIPLLIIGVPVLVGLLFEILVCFLPNYDNQQYYKQILEVNNCQDTKISTSFQYHSFQQQPNIMFSIGIIFSLTLMKNPQNLYKQLSYSRLSPKFITKYLLTLTLTIAVYYLFTTKYWQNFINIGIKSNATIFWSLNNVGYFITAVVLVWWCNVIWMWCGFQKYRTVQNFQEFCQFQVWKEEEVGLTMEQQKRIQETQLAFGIPYDSYNRVQFTKRRVID